MEKRKLFVSKKKETPRLFKSGFLEIFSKTPFWIVPIIYVPIIGFSLYKGINCNSGSILSLIGLFLGGIIAWTFSEYTFHRYVFHYQPTSNIGKRIHFILHGVHHDYPNDHLRLVLPPALSVPLAFLFFNVFGFIFKADTHLLNIGFVELTVDAFQMVFFAGFALGYLSYDMIHYATHHYRGSNRIFNAIKLHHMLHHYKEPSEGFGVSSKLWDYIFRSDFSK